VAANLLNFVRMKLKSVFLLLLFISNLSFAQQSPFSEGGFEAAIQKSKKEKKPVLLFLYATWCSHCKKMKKEVFTNPEVSGFITENFVAVAVDAEKPEGIGLKKKYPIDAFPAFFFIDPDGAVLYGLLRECTATDFISEATMALTPEKQIPYLEKQFNADYKNADRCYAYITTLKKAHLDVSVPTKKYLSTQSNEQLLTETNWRIIANGVSDIESREFQYVLKNQAAFAKVSSPVRVEKKIVNIVSELLRPFTENLDTIGYYKYRPIAKTVGLRKTDSLIFTYDLLLSERTKNWKSYAKAAIESSQTYYWNNSEKLKETTSNFQKNVADPESLKYAIKLTERANEIKPSADGYLLTARLYQKMNDFKNCREFAKKSRDFSSALGFSTKEADALLAEIQIK